MDWLFLVRVLVPGILLGLGVGKIVSRRPYYIRRILPSFWVLPTKKRIFKTVLVSIALTFALFFITEEIYLLLSKREIPIVNEEEYPFTPEKVFPPLLFLTVSFIAVLEEWIFRGILLEEFSLHLRSRTLGLVVSSILFGLMHLSNPGIYPAAAIPLTVGGMLLGVSYLWGGLLCSILTHCTYNVVALFLQLI